MTKKLKKKIRKRITYVLLTIVCALIAGMLLNTNHFFMLKNNDKTSIQSLEELEETPETIIECSSIMEGIRDIHLENGNYTLRVTGNANNLEETRDYKIELYNFYQDTHYTKSPEEETKVKEIGSSIPDERMLVAKYWGDLTIDEGVTLTAAARKKGMYVHVVGTLDNKGTISMTARGAIAEGENVYLLRNANGTFEYVPAEGGAGAPYVSCSFSKSSSTDWYKAGNAGESGTNRATGGGGSGGVYARRNDYASMVRRSGAGAAGTSYSGGSGGGAIDTNYKGTYYAGAGVANGGAGGDAISIRGSTSWAARYAGGGAGNPGGVGKYTYGGKTTGTAHGSYYGQTGTGGLLILYTDNLNNTGSIVSNGVSGGTGRVGGGSSGGGSVNIFARNVESEGTQAANGGVAAGSTKGGAGGTGTVTFKNVDLTPAPRYYLNYDQKKVVLKSGQGYQIDKTKIKYKAEYEKPLNAKVGAISYVSEDTSIATVDSNGKITAVKEGRTKIRITDTSTNYITYIEVVVQNGVEPQISLGEDFTIALKKNGSVWTFGSNENGQLGIGNNEDSLEPVQVNISGIVQIAAGYKHAVAINQAGDLYVWGDNSLGQLGDGTKNSTNIPTKMQGLSNVKKVVANGNETIALTNDGKVYIWGEGYSSFPMRVILNKEIVDISGAICLTTDGTVYDLKDINKLINIFGIAKISGGMDHSLAIDQEGTVYEWGDQDYVYNKFGIVGEKVIEVSSGTDMSMALTKNGNVYTWGSNESGKAGLGETETTATPTLVMEGNAEQISAGQWNTSAIVTNDGFVWNTGANEKGQLGTGDITNKTEYSQIGETVLKTNFDKKYLDLHEQTVVTATLENSFNLKEDIVDNNQDNFSLTLNKDTSLDVNGKTLTVKQYGTTIITVTHIPTGKTKDVTVVAAMKMVSIVQGFRDADLPDGQYTIVVNNEEYEVELINYYDDVEYTEDVELGDDSTEYKTLVVKYHKDLKVGQGVTVSAKTVDNLTYKKGMYLCVLGNIYNDGNISMTARGTYNCEGQDVFLWKNIDDTYEYVPENGGDGGLYRQFINKSTSSKDYQIAGLPGANGTNRATGGGGSGGLYTRRADNKSFNAKSGAGAAGTAFSGGSAGGGVNTNYGGTFAALSAEPNGGAGGEAFSARRNTSWAVRHAGGGAGNIGGVGKYTRSKAKIGTDYTPYSGQNGTGGLLILYADTLYNTGEISSEGSVGGNGRAGGGSSGGGSVNIFARIVEETGTQTANGGIARGSTKGGAGGDGSVTVNELGSVLNYNPKKITLKVGENYQINESVFSYIKLNQIQTEDLTVGPLTYETLTSQIATVTQTGNISANELGRTKIKVTDTENGYSTYIIVEVTDGGIKSLIEEGNDFTVALKENGTVWTWGKNIANEPIQVMTENGALEDIIDIGAGEASSIAVNKAGEVYTWGEQYSFNAKGQVVVTKLEKATKVDNLSNIKHVDCYGNNFYALDNDGKVYVWGKNYIQMVELTTASKIEEIDGTLLLGEDGRVYTVDDPITALPYLNNICNISSGLDHYLFVTLAGRVYSLGTGDLGQLGNKTLLPKTVPTLVRVENGYLENAIEVSAGTKTSFGLTLDGKAYSWGDNTSSKLGIEGKTVDFATQITKVQDKDGNELELKKIENIETGRTHSSISDEDGFVYTVGLNNLGQLGTEDNVARTIFTRIGRIEIITDPLELRIAVNTSKDVIIALGNSFNLKTDIAQSANVSLINTNDKEITIEKLNNTGSTIKDIKPNYRLTGEKIGRVNVVATSDEGHTKNIWVDVVDEENAKVAAKVENGDGFTVALRSDGTVWTFGNTNNQNNPEKIEVPEEIIDISAGKSHTLLLGKSGVVYSFGLNKNGQLGTGNVTTYKLPVKTKLEKIVKVVAVENTSFAITEDGKVYAFGAGYFKNPTLLNKEHNIIDIGINYYLSDDGIVRKVSDDEQIHLSLNEYDPADPPVYVEERIVQMSEGTDHALFLGKSGRVYSYGKNVYGQLGDKTTVARENNITTVVRVEDGAVLENIAEVSAGDQYSIATSKDGKVYTFGINRFQQLGFSNDMEAGGIQESGYAILKEDIQHVERVTAGYSHTSVYKEDGNVYTWGNGENGELGNGSYFDHYLAQLVGKNIVQTNTHGLVLRREETFDIDGWINYFNLFNEKQAEITYEIVDQNLALLDSQNGKIMALQTGRTTVIAREVGSDKISVIPLVIMENSNIEAQVETAGSHTVMLKVDGSVWCYGKGEYGELGTGNQETIDDPVKAIFPAGTVIKQIAAGENHSMALDVDGNVWVWGRNQYYQLGNNKDSMLLVPTKVAGLTNIRKIAAGNNSSFAIGENGEVYSFGLNANGEGGIGSYTNKITVTKAKEITDVIDIKAGKNYTLVLKSTGEVYATGSNLYGELGRDNTNTRKINQFTKIEGLENIVAISAGDSHASALKLDGSVYKWGANIYKQLGLGANGTVLTTPTKVPNLKDIRYISEGKGFGTAIDVNNQIFVVGLNTSGQLGNNSKTNSTTYEKLNTIDNIMQVSSGNTYTVMVRTDGSVWATGDYAHGDEQIKSKTRGIVPNRVGNDGEGFNKSEIVVEVGATKDVKANCAFEFNLLKLDGDFRDSLEYASIKEAIATVDENGIVTGNRVGTTRVNATSKINNKTYSVLVKVIEKGGLVAPKVEAGENFAAVLKADGSVWTFGYNADGRLAIGTNLTKDVPGKTNILATYEDIKVGGDFMIALRSNGTVWTVGNNKKGQLGDGTTDSKNKLSQIQGLENIEKIAAGKDFAIAIDMYGIVYEWGNGNTTPQIAQRVTERVVDIAAGNNQSVFVTAKGTVLGYGNILDGQINGIENAIKAQVTEDKIIILTVTNEVYEYQNGSLSKVNVPEPVIDISAKNRTVMYQTVDEKTYVSGENTYGQLGVGDTQNRLSPVLVNKHGENTFGLGAGYNNTYIIENTGSVYASGYNEYGSIGNSTRNDEVEHTLVGDREFKIEPITSAMKVGDVENINVTGNPFNVFKEVKISADEYTWVSDNDDIVLAETGKLTAKSEGTAHITVTDKVSGESLELTRIVIAQENDRISKITVNGEKAVLHETTTEDHLVYYVKVVTNDDTGILQVETNNLTDRISIDDGANWSYNGTFNGTVSIPNKITQIPILVGIKNNNGDYPLEENYTLIVEKITDDIGIKVVTATSKDSTGTQTEVTATPVGLTRYEVIVDEETDFSKVKVIANSGYSFVGIDGLDYMQYTQDKIIAMGQDLTKEIKIAVKSEAGREAEYTLVIYKKNALTDLIDIKVDGKSATKVSEGVYAANVANSVNTSHVKVTTDSNLVKVKIEGNVYTVKVNEKDVEVKDEKTTVKIYLQTPDGLEKEILLHIYKESDVQVTPAIDLVLVNGAVILPEKDNITYIAYLPSTETEAKVRVIAKEEIIEVAIDGKDSSLGESEQTVILSGNENKYPVVLTDPEGNSMTYYVIIRKAEDDANLDQIYVTYDVTEVQATKVDKNNYTVKVPGNVDELDVTAITSYLKSKVDVTQKGTYSEHIDTQKVTITDRETIVKINVKSENGAVEEEYILTIVKMSQNTDLARVEVDGEEASLGDDGKYHFILKDAKNSVSVKAVTEDVAPINAWANIENKGYYLYETTESVDITAKQTEVLIKVKSEDGTIKDHILVIEGLPDDATIKTVVVNGKQATYIEGKNRYEIRSKDTEFEVEVTLNDLLASMVLGTNEKAIGQDIITITKQGAETYVKVKVTSQNGLETEDYTIVIMEQSSNSNLDIVRVNNVEIKPDSDGIYRATCTVDETKLLVEAIAEDTYATTTINGTPNSSYIAKIAEQVIEGKTVYTYAIQVVAENGTISDYTLIVQQLERNTNILNVLVGENETLLEAATLKDDGKYYYKIANVEEAYIKIDLESENSTVEIDGVNNNTATVKLPTDITTVPVRIVAEDGTIKETAIIIEKKSSDTTVISATGDGVIETEIDEENIQVYVDEDSTSIDLTITLNNKFGSLRLSGETDYELAKITRTLNVESATIEAPMNLEVQVKAEDGTEKTYQLFIYKKANLKLLEVKVNDIIVKYDEEKERYEAVVDNGNSPEIYVKADNEKQTVNLEDEAGNVLATGVQVITTEQTLTDEITKYIIKVVSYQGEDYGVQEYDLWIRQKSTETGIMYVKVDGLGTILSDDGKTYSSTVSGKEKYPVEIKLIDERAKVRVQDLDGNVLIKDQVGILNGELPVPDGETKTFKMIVTSENGEEEEFDLVIERISSNPNLEKIEVTDYDSDGTTIITRQVTSYDESTKTYKIIVNKNLTESDVTITAMSSFTNITVDTDNTAKGNITVTKQLNGLGITTVEMVLVAADGTVETRYLQLIQLSDEIGIMKVEVDGLVLTADEAGNYETTVTNKQDLSNVKVTLISETSKISINGQPEELAFSEVNVSKGKARKLLIPLRVKAEDGTIYTYTLTLNIISSDVSVDRVLVDGIKASVVNEKYVAYIDNDATEADIEVIAGVEYSTITHIMEDGTELSDKAKLKFKLDTSDLDQRSFTTTFEVTAEDGETAKEYEIEIKRKSVDASIREVYVDDIVRVPNSGNPNYADGTYYATTTGNTAKVKIITNDEFATVSFNGKSGKQVLEQVVKLDADNKVTAVPVTITSQQGNTIETIIYIERLSDNCKLDSVKVNTVEAEKTDEPNTFLSYIYDSVETARVEIEANHELATIVRTDSEGRTWLDEHGQAAMGIKYLEMFVPTPEQTTTIYFKIVAESGSESPIYKLVIEKMSTDVTLQEVYVNGKLIAPNENGEYITSVLDTEISPKVKAITNHELANVRIALGDEKLHISEESITLSNYKQTTVPITVRSQSGITKVHYLYINKISTSVKLSEVTLDDREADVYNELTHTYTFFVDNIDADYDLFVLPESDYTTLLHEGVEYDSSLKTIVSMEANSEGKTIIVTAKSESGLSQEYHIDITHKSDNTNLEFLKVNDTLVPPDEEGGDTYTVMIPRLATTALIEVQTEYSYAYLRLGDNDMIRHHDKGVLDCSDIVSPQIVVPIVVTASDGKTTRTYHLVLVRGSNNTEIELQVNNKVLTKDENGNYETEIRANDPQIDIIANIIPEHDKEVTADIDINATGVYETPTKQVILPNEDFAEKDKLEIPIRIVAQDGTVRESTLTITIIKGSYITGKILTENANGEHISTITVYEVGADGDPDKEVKKVQTNPDGTFKILMYMEGQDDEAVLLKKYKIVATKNSYLDYIVTNIEITENEITRLEPYNLVAGDIIKTGEIEIDDLVSLNDNVGITITEDKLEKQIYDLNEDGIVDKLDRDILKKNYSKKTEVIKWINPKTRRKTRGKTEEEELPETETQARKAEVSGFMPPIEGTYTITSPYGTRVHPVTGVEKKHTGIDIGGEHHTNILAVADGEVVFSGVQTAFGNCIEIKHEINGQTIYTFYAHMSKLDVKVGDKVEQGQVIGLEGGDPQLDPNPGYSTGHHLHFEVRTKSGYGNDVDPNDYINF